MAQTDQERQNGLIITTVVLTALSFIVVTTRSVVRIGLMKKGGWDDYLMILAMVSLESFEARLEMECVLAQMLTVDIQLLSVGYFAEIMVLRENKVGFSAALLTPENMVNFLKVCFPILFRRLLGFPLT